MSYQDDAFDIEHACKRKCPQAAKEFIEYTWSLEEEVSELRQKLHNLEITINVLKERNILNKE